MRNPSTNLCLDTLGKDEKTSFDVSVYPCQNGASASEVSLLKLKDFVIVTISDIMLKIKEICNCYSR